MTADLETDVLIIGGGPSGMVSALCLARAGIKSIVMERASVLATHPKAHEVNARSIEILTSLGLTYEELEVEASAHADAARILFCKTINEEFGRIDLLADEVCADKYRRHLRSQRPYLNLSQTELEKIMLEHVKHCAETEFLFEHQWEAFEETSASVISRIRRLSDDRLIRVESRYGIAADGAASRARAALGIDMDGPEKIQDFVNAYFELDLRDYVETPAKLYWILNPRAAGTLIAHHVEKRWVYHVPLFSPYECAEDYTPEVFRRRIQDALGTRDKDIRIESISFWRMTAQLASSFRKGRVFLVGDAAHRFPPTGGLGMNTGIADAHNLCWKLAAVLKGTADETLLDTYEKERRPIAERNCAESAANYDKIYEVVEALGIPRNGLETIARVKNMPPFKWFPRAWREALFRALDVPVYWMLRKFDTRPEVRRRVLDSIAHQTPHFDRIGLDIGYAYESGALVSDGSYPDQPEDPVTQYLPSARPGARFPHLWLDGANKTRSIHDVFDPTRFTLLVGDDGDAWKRAVGSLHGLPRTDLEVCAVGTLCASEEARRGLMDVCAIEDDGAILIRPDGHVAWRQRALSPRPEEALQQALQGCYLR